MEEEIVFYSNKTQLIYFFQSLESQQTSSDHEGVQIPECFSLQSTVWSKPMKNSTGTTRNSTVSFTTGTTSFFLDSL